MCVCVQECVDRDWWEPGPESPRTGFHCLLPPESVWTETSGTSWLHECECVISLALASTKLNHKKKKRLFPKIRNPTEAINKRKLCREITMHGLCGVSWDWQVCLVPLVALKRHKREISKLDLLWYLCAYMICRIVYHSEPSSQTWRPVYSLLYWQHRQVQHHILHLRKLFWWYRASTVYST